MTDKADVVLLHGPGAKLDALQTQCFDSGAREFLAKLHKQFELKIELLYFNRQQRNIDIRISRTFMNFKQSPERNDKNWQILPLPSRLKNRQVELGDVSAANTAHFMSALNANVQSIQVDFDDGHCPTWRNQLTAYNNIFGAVHATHKLPGGPPSITACPVLIFRPRAWNIIEHNILIDGKEAPGALIDFAIIMYHNAAKLYETNSGPYFYLSKLESSSEARLWNEIFTWTEMELGLPHATIKACVLIENLFAVLELDEILFALRDHSMGLNCGMWDYCASIIAKLGDRNNFILPDRNKYVNMDQPFLLSYMQLVIATAHRRGAPATGGLAPQMLNQGTKGQDSVSKKSAMAAIDAKSKEIHMGVDGFIIFDPLLVHVMNELWKRNTVTNVVTYNVAPGDLLAIPTGGVTIEGLERNVTVTIMFIYYWLDGKGHYCFGSNLEDSATAEISRWQVWQWVRFGVCLEDSTKRVSALLVEKTCAKFVLDSHKSLCRSNSDRKRLNAARYMSSELFFARDPPEFITTYLNDNHKFRAQNNKALLKAHL